MLDIKSERQMALFVCSMLEESDYECTDRVLELPGADVFTNTIVTMNVVDDVLFVGFQFEPSEMDSTLVDVCGGKYNQQLLDEAIRILPPVMESMLSYMNNREAQGLTRTERTVFTGHRLGAALAVLLASVSTPSAIYTFGMPAFCGRDLEESIYTKAIDRSFRLGNPQDFVFESYHMVDDGHVRNRSDELEHIGDITWWHPMSGWRTEVRSWVRRLAEAFYWFPNFGDVNDYRMALNDCR